jgi:uncharacterized protein (DUF302 family)
MLHYTKKIRKPYQEVTNTITRNLQKQGFGILTTIDVTDSLKKNLGVKFRNYRIMGACNPECAYKVLSLESHIGEMLPCNIVVQEHENGEIEISAVNPMETIDNSMNPTLEGIVNEVSKRLRMAVDEIA